MIKWHVHFITDAYSMRLYEMDGEENIEVVNQYIQRYFGVNDYEYQLWQEVN